MQKLYAVVMLLGLFSMVVWSLSAESLPIEPTQWMVTKSDEDGVHGTLTVSREALVRSAQTMDRSSLYKTLIALPPSADVVVKMNGELAASEHYTVSRPMIARDLRFVTLEIYRSAFARSAELDVAVEFVGGELESAEAFDEPHSLFPQLLNVEQAKQWRNIPRSVENQRLRPPVGRTSYKIDVAEDGIYQIDYGMLRAAGMNVDQVDPHTLTMMYRGQSLAYQWIGDDDGVFEPNEAVRFYGWAFKGSRSESQYITNNVFWLWAEGDSAETITQTLPIETGTAVTTYRATVNAEEDRIFHPGWTNQWPRFPNEADAWYWHLFHTDTEPFTSTFKIPLPNPVTTGAPINFVIEMMGREMGPHNILVAVNGIPDVTGNSWSGNVNVNLYGTLNADKISGGFAQFEIKLASLWTDDVYLNRIKVEYDRYLVADQNQLIFTYPLTGTFQFDLSGFDSADLIAWNITTPDQPIAMNYSAPLQVGGSYRTKMGADQSIPSTYLVTTVQNIRQPVAITPYQSADLMPTEYGAEWLAIAPAEFMTETRRLAAHRTNYSQLWSGVVDVEDVIMQYGFGLPLPSAIRDYLIDAMSWPAPPKYVLLAGDATINPRQLDCTGNGGCYDGWDPNERTFVPTNLLYWDRYLGLIPSDHPYTTIVGTDDVPDLAIGRLPADSADELSAMVDKIILYETNLLSAETWMTDVFFISDDTDGGGDFCTQNQMTAAELPTGFGSTQLCLNSSPTETDTMRFNQTIIDHINQNGALIANYRGHGSLTDWGGGIMDRDDIGRWENSNRPIVLLSADCLDNHYAWPGFASLSETFLGAKGKGTAAHWGSTGVGYTYEHTALLTGFYDGLFDHGLTAIGGAINYAKLQYLIANYDRSELYAFTLQGDPAMQLLRSELKTTGSISAVADSAETYQFDLAITNHNLYPTGVNVTQLMPPGFELVSVDGNRPITMRQSESGETIYAIRDPLHWNEMATLKVIGREQLKSQAGDIYVRPIINAELGYDIAANDRFSLELTIPSEATAVQEIPSHTETRLGAVYLILGLVCLLAIYTAKKYR